MDIFTSVCLIIGSLLGVRLWFSLLEDSEAQKRNSKKRVTSRPRAVSDAKRERLEAFAVARQLRSLVGVESNALYTVTTITQGPDIPPTQTQAEQFLTPTQRRENKKKELEAKKKEPEPPKRSFFDRIRDDDDSI